MRIIFEKVIEAIKLVFGVISIMMILVLYLEWNDEQSKISNQYSSEDVYEEVLHDVKVKMSEKHKIPIENIRIVRNEMAFSLGYEYLAIEVNEDDKEIETYIIDDPKIQSEIDDAIDASNNGISEEELREKYDIGDDAK